MARAAIEVTFKGVDDVRVPDALTEGAIVLMDLEARGVLAEVGKRLSLGDGHRAGDESVRGGVAPPPPIPGGRIWTTRTS